MRREDRARGRGEPGYWHARLCAMTSNRFRTTLPVAVCVGWLVIVVLGFVVGGQVMSRFNGTGLNVVSSESYQAGQYLDQQDPSGDQITALIVGSNATSEV